MKVYTAFVHPKGLFIHAEWPSDFFWVRLSKSLGWGKFSIVNRSDSYSPTGGIFELSEVQPADSLPPSPIVRSSNVLWCLPEAREVLLSVKSL